MRNLNFTPQQRARFFIFCLIFSALLFPACRKNNSRSTEVFVESSIGDASNLNPLLSSDSVSSSINGLVYNGLVKYGPDLKLTGDLAERWDISEGGRRIVFYLRPNVHWHDGSAFTADDVLYTYERVKDPLVKTPHSSNYDLVESVKALGELTVEVRYKEPFVPALESWGMGMVSRRVFGNAQGTAFNAHPANKHPVGTGPYVFSEWQTDQKIVLRANPDYFDGPPKIERYVLRIIPDNAVEFLELRNESIDTMLLTPDQYHAYDSFFTHYNRYRLPRGVYTYFAFNLRRPLFADQRVRQALAHAIDKKTLVQSVLSGLGQSASGPFLPLSWAYNPETPDFEYNPELAKKMLSECGFSDSDGDGVLDRNGEPFAFTVITNQGNKMRSMAAEIIQQDFSRIGVRMNIRIIEWSSFIHQFIDKFNFDATLLGWTVTPDPDNFSIWHSSQRKEGQYNFVGYANPRVDQILEAGRKEFNFEKRRALYQEMHQIVHDEAPYIFLFYPDQLPVVHKRFQGIDVQPISSFGFTWNFDKWYAEPTREP